MYRLSCYFAGSPRSIGGEGTLAAGQVRQALLVAQIAVEPRLLLLDEPTRGLDPVTRREFVSLLVELLGNGTTSILLASNTLSDVERLAERVGFLHHGRIVFENRKEDLVDQVLLLVFPRERAAALRASKHPRLLRAWEENGECRALIHAADGTPEDDIAALDAGEPLPTRRLPLEEMFIALLG